MLSFAIKVTFDGKKTNKIIMDGANRGIEMCTMRWEAIAKNMTTVEKHLITGRYRGSINASKGSPPNYIDASKVQPNDGVHTSPKPLYWIAGSNVEYAPDLEKRYGMFARSLDAVKPECSSIVAEEIAKLLK